MLLKRFLKNIFAWVYYVSFFHKRIHNGKAIVLMYHRVLKDNDDRVSYTQPGMYVTESVFNEHIRYLSAEYEVVGLDELVTLLDSKKLDPDKKYCAITFDDGWLDNYETAYPVLKRYKTPATIFLPTSYVGTKILFWPDRAAYMVANHLESLKDANFSDPVDSNELTGLFERIRFNVNGKIHGREELIEETIGMLKTYPVAIVDSALDRIYDMLEISFPETRVMIDWDEAKEMSQNGIVFGSHTGTHALLTEILLEDAKKELCSSLETLQKSEVNYIPYIAYPNGYYDESTAKLAKDVGYRGGVTTLYGVESSDAVGLMELKRIGVHNDISYNMPQFLLHISGLLRRR